MQTEVNRCYLPFPRLSSIIILKGLGQAENPSSASVLGFSYPLGSDIEYFWKKYAVKRNKVFSAKVLPTQDRLPEKKKRERKWFLVDSYTLKILSIWFLLQIWIHSKNDIEVKIKYRAQMRSFSILSWCQRIVLVWIYEVLRRFPDPSALRGRKIVGRNSVRGKNWTVISTSDDL